VVSGGTTAITEGDPDRRVGLVSALRNEDVRRSVGTLVEVAERVGAAQADSQIK
jgi:uncharacterized protein YjgD (DUF1641 family)